RASDPGSSCPWRRRGRARVRSRPCGSRREFPRHCVGVAKRGSSGRLAGGLSPQAEKMADGEDQFGFVHRVEVEILDATVDKIENLFGGDSRGHETARCRIVL